MPLREWGLENRNQPVDYFVEYADGLVLDAPYQRQPVWTLEDRRALVESMMEGLPIGALYVNQRRWGDEHVQVVDGQQRILALQAFMADEVPVPVEWFADEDLRRPRSEYADGLVVFGDLTGRRQFKLRMFPVAVYWTNLPDVEAEARLYLRLNRSGVAQTGADLDRAAAVAAVVQEVQGNAVTPAVAAQMLRRLRESWPGPGEGGA